MTWPAREPADMLARLGRHWGWVFAYGVLTLLAGVFVLAWPGATLLVLALLGFVATSRWALATAQRTAAELNPENLTVQPVAA